MAVPTPTSVQADTAAFVTGQMLADAKAQLNITDTSDDALITGKLYAVIDWVGRYNGQSYLTTLYGVTAADGTVTYAPPIPAPVYEAILQIVAHLYANREASLVGVTAQALPLGALDLLMPFRAWGF